MDKILNLVPAIKEIESKIQKMEYEFEQEVGPYRDSLEQLRKLNQACEHCNGLGKKLRSRACAEDDIDPNDPRDWEKCYHCNGTGVIKKGEYMF